MNSLYSMQHMWFSCESLFVHQDSIVGDCLFYCCQFFSLVLLDTKVCLCWMEKLFVYYSHELSHFRAISVTECLKSKL